MMVKQLVAVITCTLCGGEAARGCDSPRVQSSGGSVCARGLLPSDRQIEDLTLDIVAAIFNRIYQFSVIINRK